jgi:hypothetical protein
MRFVKTVNLHSQLSANAGYVSSRDPLASHALAPVTFSESAIASGGAALDLWRLEGEYQVRNHTYETPGHLDGFSQGWQASLFPFRRPDTQGVMSVRGRDVKIEKEQALSTVAVTGGMRRTHFEGLSSELEVGAASTRDPRRGTNEWDLALVAGVTAERGALRMPFNLRFRFMRDVTTTGFAEAALPVRHGRLAVRWEQNLGAEGGSFQDPTLSRYFTFEAADTLLGAYLVSLEGSMGQTQSFFVSDTWLNTSRAWASLSRRLAPWLTAAVDYSFVNQDGDQSQSSWVFQRNRVGLRLTVGAQ